MHTGSRLRGFSLIEILVVIVIIAIVASIALLSLNVLGDDRNLQTEARRVISLVEVAQDEAMMQGREFGLEVMQASYRFVEYDAFTNQWGELLGDDTFRMRQLNEELEFDLFLEEQRVILEPDPAAFEKAEESANRDLSKSYAPHILIFSSGDITPFELHITRPQANQAVILRSDPSGAIEIVTEDE
ncbi:MAG: type II secretion system minor pseudopilin GspH [Gammaproteobacteria bacterium]|nr:type II secretion system minor pseudopilin GspH [Gammaproteobacteria bacterium]